MRRIVESDKYARRMTIPEDIMFCTECGEMCDIAMPDAEMLWNGPLAVCRNNYCGYFVRSLEHTREKMGVSWMYRNCYSYADENWFPVTFTATDNAQVFWPMGPPWEAIRQWNASIDAWEGGGVAQQDWENWESMYPDMWSL